MSAAEKDVNKGEGKGKGKKKATNDMFTKNIVYKEVLTLRKRQCITRRYIFFQDISIVL